MRKTLSIYFVLLTVALTACQENLPPDNRNSDNSDLQITNDGMIVLGDPINNPFTVQNMRAAYAELKRTRSSTPEVEIKTSHLYVRFLPASFQEYVLLDSLFIISPLPYDRPVVVAGSYYHDPSLPEDSETWQYSVIPVDTSLPQNIRYELLCELFLPPLDIDDVPETRSTLAKGTTFKNAQLLDLSENLITQARKRTGHDDGKALQTRAARYTPKGSIKVVDTKVNKLVPLIGLEVDAILNWFYTKQVHTDVNGNFQTGSTVWEATYRAYYRRYHFHVRMNKTAQAILVGPENTTQPWNRDIYGSEHDHFSFSHVYRACWDYYYDNTFNIGLPKLADFFTAALMIGVLDEYDSRGGYFKFNFTNFLGMDHDIGVFRKFVLESHKLYAIATHELSHAAHFAQNKTLYTETERVIRESWAGCAQWYIVKERYKLMDPIKASGLDGEFNLHDKTTQWYSGGYTPLFIDLIDGGNDYYRSDNISGYTISEVWSFVLGSRNIQDVRNKVLANPKGNSVDDIKNVFDYYQSINYIQ